MEYLVLWKGFSKFDSSWEPEENITPECVRRPRPDVAVIQMSVDSLRVAVERQLEVEMSIGGESFF